MVSRWKLFLARVFVVGVVGSLAIEEGCRDASAQARASDQQLVDCRARSRVYADAAANNGADSFFFGVIASVSQELCGFAQGDTLSPSMLEVESALFARWYSNSSITPAWAALIQQCRPMQLSRINCASRLASQRYRTEMPPIIGQLRPPCIDGETARTVSSSIEGRTFALLIPFGEYRMDVRRVIADQFLAGVANLVC
jgi:hypothetical protein